MRGSRREPTGSAPPRRRTRVQGVGERSTSAGHESETYSPWPETGVEVETPEDLLVEDLLATCVGINPSPVSVAAGHYYQGTVGQRFFARLREAGAFAPVPGEQEDDSAFAAGIGFTDIVKRPTGTAKDVRPAEFSHGRDPLEAKLDRFRPRLLVFTFEKTAEILFGRFPGNGFMPDLRLAHTDVFVMPGPYESGATSKATLQHLAERFNWQRQCYSSDSKYRRPGADGPGTPILVVA